VTRSTSIRRPEIDACGNLFVTGFTVGDPADPAETPLMFGDSFLYRVDTNTGARTRIGDTGGTDWMDLAFDSKGRLWATTGNKLYFLDPRRRLDVHDRHHGGPEHRHPGDLRGRLPYMEVMTIASTRTTCFGERRCGASACASSRVPLC